MDRNVTIGTATKATDQNYSVSTKTGDYTILDTDNVDCFIGKPASTGNVNFTLPTAADNDVRAITFINGAVSGGSITITPEGSETLNAGTAQSCYGKHDRLSVICDASEYFVTAGHISYSTGWVNISDWANVHLSSDGSTTGSVIHNLNANIDELNVKILISTTASIINSFQGIYAVKEGQTADHGLGLHAVDNNNIIVQIASGGLRYVANDGTVTGIVTLNGYYNIIVEKRI